MRLTDFDFALPDDLIALRPVVPRSASRLLVVRDGGIEDADFTGLAAFLRPGDLLVFNDTQVIPARLFGARRRETTDGSGLARVEATLIERLGEASWRALAKPARKLAKGDRVVFGDLGARVVARDGGTVDLVFDVAGADLDSAVARLGVMPLPPYIAGKRAADDRDAQDYQTHFAARSGAVAAPTASLHFDGGILAACHARGIGWTRVTLHVGAGTFLPVTADRPEDHTMHAEWGEISEKAADRINAVRARGGRIIAAGTTALRLLESAVDGTGRVQPYRGETDIFIMPGHRFRAIDGLITNFHLPKSTLVMLVSALMGVERTRAIYAHAVARKYRFYSYGDGSLLIP